MKTNKKFILGLALLTGLALAQTGVKLVNGLGTEIGTSANPLVILASSGSSVMIGNAAQTTAAAASTRFIGTMARTVSTTEATVQGFIGMASTASRMRIRTASTQDAGGSLVFTLRKNGVNTAVTCTVPAGGLAQTCADLTNTASFADGDLISIMIQNNAGAAASASIDAIGLLMTPR